MTAIENTKFGNEASPAWVRQARGIVDDLHRHSPVIYWADFLLSVGAAWAFACLYMVAAPWSAPQVLALLAAGILFFRAGTFIHEIIHFRPGEMVWFGRVWNLLLGVPLLMPWILYRNHIEHHSVRYFGTPDDGEYLPLAAAPLRETLLYLLQAPLLPLLVVLRFGVLSPLSWLHRGLREWVLVAASAGVTNPYYRKRFPANEEWHLRIVEVLCFVWLVAISAWVYLGHVSGPQLFKVYLLFALTLTLNWVRNLAAHGYANRGARMSYTKQFADSINITGQTWLTMLLFPVGLRYHALHHLFPTLPYHNLGKAHQRLTAQLSADSPYHAAGRRSFFVAVAELWRGALHTAPQESAVNLWRNRNTRS